MNGEDERIVQHSLTVEERDAIRSAIAEVCRRHDWIRAAYLFGSAARDEGAVRDVDVGIVAARSAVAWDAPAHLANELEDASGFRKVPFDVRLLDDASPVFLGSVLREGDLVYEVDREERVRFEALAMSRWLDFRPAWERVRGAVLREWAGG